MWHRPRDLAKGVPRDLRRGGGRRHDRRGRASAAIASSSPKAPSWVDRPMRWAQLTLVEDDPGKFDPAVLARLLPPDPLRRRLPERRRLRGLLSDEDPVPPPQRVAGRPRPVRRSGRRLPQAGHGRHRADRSARDLRGCRTQAHPDWIAVDADGSKRRHWASPEMWVTCALGPYNFEFMTEVHREIVARYRVDGIFINRWAGSGMCYCEHCRTNFKAATGHGPAADRTIRRTRPAAPTSSGSSSGCSSSGGCGTPRSARSIPTRAYIPNTGGGAHQRARHEDHRRAGARSCSPTARRRSGLMPPWANGKNGKEYRATMGRKPIGGIFSVGVEEPYRWKDSVQSPAEIRIWVARRHRQRPAALVHQVRRHAPRPALAAASSRSSTAGITATSATCATRPRSPASAWSTRSRPPGSTAARRPGQNVEDHMLGWYQALVEARIPFEMVHDRLLDAEHMSTRSRP